MTLASFMRIVELVANTTWVRYYLSSYPGQMVLEIADLGGSGLGTIPQELAEKGFTPLGAVNRWGVACARFSVTRTF